MSDYLIIGLSLIVSLTFVALIELIPSRATRIRLLGLGSLFGFSLFLLGTVT